MFDLEDYLKKQSDRITAELDRHMPPAETHPALLHEAMRYSVFSGGKRIRPILCMASAKAVCGSDDPAVLPALALELLHTYTLIHDDLPSMDDDDIRRGQPTSHKKYGEANAILSGDALQAMAFSMLSNEPAPSNYPPLQLLSELSEAAGSQGVVGGQVEDINHGDNPTFEQIQYIHLHKTACLFRASLRMGAIAANADENQLEALSNYGTNIGLAFQITDDLLDRDQSDTKELSCLMIYTPDEAAKKARELISQAESEISIFSTNNTEPLNAIAQYILERQL